MLRQKHQLDIRADVQFLLDECVMVGYGLRAQAQLLRCSGRMACGASRHTIVFTSDKNIRRNLTPCRSDPVSSGSQTHVGHGCRATKRLVTALDDLDPGLR